MRVIVIYMECVVCFSETSSKLDPCTHVVCEPCMRQWIDSRKRYSHHCPVCRRIVISLTCHTIDLDASNKGTYSCIPPSLDDIRFENCAQGVRVLSVDSKKNVRKAIRKGDVITHVNTIPIFDHYAMTSIYECAKKTQQPLVIRRHIRPTLFRRVWGRVPNASILRQV